MFASTRRPCPSGAFVTAVVLAAAAALGALAVLPGCSPHPGPNADERCPALPGSVRDHATPWIFALCEDVDPAHVLSPRNDAEDVVFRYAYEGLTDVDCRGGLVPRLAASWTSDGDGRVWTFVLRTDRTFDDGTPVTPDEVLRTWSQARSEGWMRSHRKWLWRGLMLRRTTVDGPRLTIELAQPDPDFPFRLAMPEFSVLRGRPGGWPFGTRGRVAQVWEIEGGQEISFAPLAGTRDAAPSPVVFRVLPGTDPRDAFGADTQALLTRDRRALRYLAAQRDTRLTPLPWTRRYALVDPTGDFSWVNDTLMPLRGELARDVLPSVARAPWDPGPEPASAAPASSAAFAIRYVQNDPDGAALAERVASLATQRGSGQRWIVVGAPPASVHSGETPSIVALLREGFDPPPTRREPAALELAGTVYPLADTRAHLVTRDGIAGVRFGWDGTPRLDDAGRTGRPGR